MLKLIPNKLKEQFSYSCRFKLKYWLRGWHAQQRMTPYFLGIGVQKAGSTSLYTWLTKHPNIMAHTGELHFFDLRHELGLKWYRSNFPLKIWPYIFNKKIITGEVTPNYIFSPSGLSRIRQMFPNVKLIVLLRDPIERTVSHFFHNIAKGREKRSLEEALKTEKKILESSSEKIFNPSFFNKNKIHNFSYLSRSLYDLQLERLFNLFPRNQVIVLESEVLFRGKNKPLNELTAFLNLPPSSHPFPHVNNRRDSKLENIDSKIINMLRSFFSPHMKRLANILGQDFSWFNKYIRN